MSKKRKLYGIDGCPAGWVVAVLKSGDKKPKIDLFENLADALYSARKRDIVCIDIPIGLPEEDDVDSGRRLCDLHARKLLGRKGSSVFAAPTRGTMEFCDDYQTANEWSKSQTGRGLTKQTFNIMPKIKAVDDMILSDQIKAKFHETHPELIFACKNGSNKKPKPIFENKATIEGQIQRLNLLPEPWRKLVDQAVAHLGPKSARVNGRSCKLWAPDDVIDALACLHAAQRIAGHSGGKSLRCPDKKKPPRDAYHLPMQIHA